MRRTLSLTALVSAAVLGLAACGGNAGDPPPSAPAGVTAQAGSATTVHVMWRGATGAAHVSGYEVYRGGRKVKNVPAGQTMVDIVGLTPSTSYTFTVLAKDAEGRRSPHSGAKAVTTPAAVAEDTTAPARPTGLKGRSAGPRGARLSWHRPKDGRDITSYDIQQAGTKIHSVDGGAASAQITGLRPGTRYRFTITARDAADNASPVSGTVEVTTPHGPADDPDTRPADFRVTTHDADGGHYLDLSWQPPDTGGTVTSYQIYLDGAFATTLVWGGEAPSGRATYSVYAGAGPGVGYRVKIRAQLPDGDWGAFSAERTVVTPVGRT